MGGTRAGMGRSQGAPSCETLVIMVGVGVGVGAGEGGGGVVVVSTYIILHECFT